MTKHQVTKSVNLLILCGLNTPIDSFKDSQVVKCLVGLSDKLVIALKETARERADFTLQLSIFAIAEEREINVKKKYLFPFFVSGDPRGFKQEQAERVQAIKAQTNWPRWQLFPM